jgi:hypothetical protein
MLTPRSFRAIALLTMLGGFLLCSGASWRARAPRPLTSISKCRSRARRRGHPGHAPIAVALVIAGRIADVDQLRVFRANLPFLWGHAGDFCS